MLNLIATGKGVIDPSNLKAGHVTINLRDVTRSQAKVLGMMQERVEHS